jgi:hypothetical protein
MYIPVFAQHLISARRIVLKIVTIGTDTRLSRPCAGKAKQSTLAIKLAMASFPILKRETEPSNKLDAHEPAVLAYRRDPLREPYRAPKSVAEVGGLDEIQLPAVVLQLPDLKSASLLRRGGRIPFASHAYWVALVLGALLALWLALSGRKPVERPTEEAPTWTGQQTPTADRPISTWGDNTGAPSAPASKWRASDTDTGATASESPASSAPALPAIETAPPMADGAVAPSQQSEAIRTARGGETRWDGSSNRIQPSEAAPLGITTPVPQ